MRRPTLSHEVGVVGVSLAGEGLQFVVAGQEGAVGVQGPVGVFSEGASAGRVAGFGIGDGAAPVLDLFGELVLGLAGGLTEGRELAAEGPFGLDDRLRIDHAGYTTLNVATLGRKGSYASRRSAPPRPGPLPHQ
jgi:hypothetical protein